MSRIGTAIVILVCICGLRAGSAAAGEIRGKIIVTKVLTKKRVLLPDYQVRGVAVERAAAADDEDEFSRTVVYLDTPSQPAAGAGTASLVQKGIHFSPEILVIQVGSTVSFPNRDPIFHNVFSLSRTKQFDLGYYPAGQTRLVKFEKPGIVEVYCHIHRDMNAAILVVPNHWHVQPDEHGNFSLTGVPAGALHVVVWHKAAGFFRKLVQVPETGVAQVSFTIPVPSKE